MTAPCSLEGRRVLVVEDEALVALDLCLVLEALGCSPVGPASTVDAAMELLRGRPDLDAALLDEHLGTALVTPVAEVLAARGVPFVVVSGRARSMSNNPLLLDAPRLPKPARTQRIAHALATLLEAR